MEELVGTRHPNTSHDLLLLLHHLLGPHGAYDDCEYKLLICHSTFRAIVCDMRQIKLFDTKLFQLR